MRLIPKKSKVNLTVWKNFTLLDIVFLLALMVIGILIISSNLDMLVGGFLPVKWLIMLIYVPLGIGLFIGNEDTRIYKELVHILRFFILGKNYGAAGKKNTKKNSVDLLLPQQNITAEGVIEYGEYFAGVLSLGSVEFRLLGEYVQNQKINLFADVINYLSDEQTMQIVKIDRPINFDEISENLYNKVEKVKTADDDNVARVAILKSRLDQIDQINNIKKQYRPYYYLVFFDESVDSLKNLLAFAKQTIVDIGLNPAILSQKEVAVFLKYCYTRNFDERDVDNYKPEQYLNFVKPKGIGLKVFNYKVDDVYAFTYSIAEFPLQVANAWGATLFNIDNTKVVLNIKPIAKDRGVKRIDRAITELGTRGETLNKASEIISQGTHIETMAHLLAGLQNENEMLFDCTMTITGFNYGNEYKDSLYNKDKEKRKEIRKLNSAFRKDIRRRITAQGFRPNMLMCRQFDGLISSSITRRNNLRTYERGINSLSLAAVFPFVFTSIIEPDGLTLGHHAYPVILDVWKRDSNYTNSNMFVVGKSGSGKSFFAKTLLSLLHSDNCKISILDPENEYNEMAKNFGGKMVDVGNATTGRLNPFHIYDILTEDGAPATPDVTFASHLRFLESFFRVVLVGITSDSIEELNNLVLDTYKKKKITQETDCSGFDAKRFPTFDDLLKIIKEAIQEAKGHPIRQNNLQRVETYITKFAGDGRNSNLWNGESTLSSNERFEVFNFQSLFVGNNSTISNGQMLLVMRYLEQNIIKIREKNRNSDPKDILHPVIVLDEGYKFVDPTFPIALDFVYSWYKRIRKYGGFIIFLTQNLGDIFGNKDIISKTTAIINNSQYSYIFGLAPADIETLKDLYRNAGEINETEANEIANAGTGQCFLISSPRERTSFKVVASDTVKELFSKPVSSERIAELAGIKTQEREGE